MPTRRVTADVMKAAGTGPAASNISPRPGGFRGTRGDSSGAKWRQQLSILELVTSEVARRHPVRFFPRAGSILSASNIWTPLVLRAWPPLSPRFQRAQHKMLPLVRQDQPPRHQSDRGFLRLSSATENGGHCSS
jgi:hypothetical protein